MDVLCFMLTDHQISLGFPGINSTANNFVNLCQIWDFALGRIDTSCDSVQGNQRSIVARLLHPHRCGHYPHWTKKGTVRTNIAFWSIEAGCFLAALSCFDKQDSSLKPFVSFLWPCNEGVRSMRSPKMWVQKPSSDKNTLPSTVQRRDKSLPTADSTFHWSFWSVVVACVARFLHQFCLLSCCAAEVSSNQKLLTVMQGLRASWKEKERRWLTSGIQEWRQQQQHFNLLLLLLQLACLVFLCGFVCMIFPEWESQVPAQEWYEEDMEQHARCAMIGLIVCLCN
jgi:hypothetical protein